MDTLTGQRIKTIRITLGKTQADFADSINQRLDSDGTVTRGTVNNWEHGRNLPNKRRLKIIADLGGVSVDYLLHGSSITVSTIDSLAEKYKRGTITPDEKLLMNEASIDFRVETSNMVKATKNMAEKVFNETAYESFSPSQKVLAVQISRLMLQLKEQERDGTDNLDELFTSLTAFMSGLTTVISGEKKPSEFKEFQDSLTTSINKHFK
ncbi:MULTISPECIES: helix-turn-helix domain-containing protein [Lactiplantibacillus]|uniref:helix-turn-helix domain-containing protein n=1 Tax=Lactiplantibacillus TaxID=2767842 RepID=UPI001C1F8C92|nr:MULTISPECIES: helix-turn-helix transcriptional regulator [Lactiplantibacillus]MBU7448426.1 helix-turn-helix transcriptional regulator [Lactiplantibacillus sp. 7.2.4]MBU7480969.1 helix-turn-helix transcriptional regulator [Lactiplantibacillus pentosus]